jgi:hypothetical protein
MMCSSRLVLQRNAFDGGRLRVREAGTPTRGHELLFTLQCVREVRGKIDRTELATVRQAREVGISWTEIATSLGVSRQAAWERWHEVDGDVRAAR